MLSFSFCHNFRKYWTGWEETTYNICIQQEKSYLNIEILFLWFFVGQRNVCSEALEDTKYILLFFNFVFKLNAWETDFYRLTSKQSEQMFSCTSFFNGKLTVTRLFSHALTTEPNQSKAFKKRPLCCEEALSLLKLFHLSGVVLPSLPMKLNKNRRSEVLVQPCSRYQVHRNYISCRNKPKKGWHE